MEQSQCHTSTEQVRRSTQSGLQGPNLGREVVACETHLYSWRCLQGVLAEVVVVQRLGSDAGVAIAVDEGLVHLRRLGLQCLDQEIEARPVPPVAGEGRGGQFGVRAVGLCVGGAAHPTPSHFL